jgi:amidohydrolase
MISTVFPTSTPTLSGVRLAIRQLQPQIVLWRRQIHQQPELAFREAKTAAFISQKLTKWGIEHETGVATTGIVAVVRGRKPGPVLAIRADMDALPIQEMNDVEYRSQQDGVMHACGHDGHVAIALGTAYYLSQHRDSFYGTVKFIFQPAEEGPGGGEADDRGRRSGAAKC